MCWPIIVTPESRSMQKASKSGREKVGLAMSRSFFRCVVSALPSSKDLDTFYAFNTPRSSNRSTPKIPKSHLIHRSYGQFGIAFLLFCRRALHFRPTNKLGHLDMDCAIPLALIGALLGT